MSPKAQQSDVERELIRLLESKEFAGADRAARFLRYVVDRTLAGDREALKESVVGTEVFDRPPGYDTKAEPIVRTEARRLRTKLDEFYGRTSDSSLRISMPKGGYVAAFDSVSPCTLQGARAPVTGPSAFRRYGIAVALGALALTAVAALWLGHRDNGASLPAVTIVTSFPGAQVSPSLSPDGRRVAFVWRQDDGRSHVYTANADGSHAAQLTSAPEADTATTWSLDGRHIAFIRAGKGVMTIDPPGSNERFVTKAYPSFLAWSPDSSWLLFSDWTSDGKQFALFRVDATGDGRRQISSPPKGIDGDLFGDVSPDGLRIAFGRCRPGSCDLLTMPGASGAPRELLRGGAPLAGITWNPNGRSLVFSSRRQGQYQLWKMDASDGATPEPIAVAGEDARSPRFAMAAGGAQRLVYEQRITDTNIWRIRLDASGAAAAPRRVIASTRLDSSPQVSPDGRRIAFVSDRSGYSEIWTVDAAGESPAELTHLRPQSLGSPRWSPDGRQLAFDVSATSGRAIFLSDAGGGEPRQWTGRTYAGRPSWSRDGRWIYFGDRDAAGVTRIFRASTTVATERVPVTNESAFEGFESPDGKSLYYVHEGSLRRLPLQGGESSTVFDRPVSMGLWCVARTGIYFVDVSRARKSGPYVKGDFSVNRLDPGTGAIERVATISGTLDTALPDFTVSPDGKAIYYSLLEVSVSQIRMIEGRM